MTKEERELLDEAKKLRGSQPCWYMLRYDMKTSAYNNDIEFKTYEEALKDYEAATPAHEGERVELIFAPEDGDEMFYDNIMADSKTEYRRSQPRSHVVQYNHQIEEVKEIEEIKKEAITPRQQAYDARAAEKKSNEEAIRAFFKSLTPCYISVWVSDCTRATDAEDATESGRHQIEDYRMTVELLKEDGTRHDRGGSDISMTFECEHHWRRDESNEYRYGAPALAMNCCSPGSLTRAQAPGIVDKYMLMANIWAHEKELGELLISLPHEKAFALDKINQAEEEEARAKAEAEREAKEAEVEALIKVGYSFKEHYDKAWHQPEQDVEYTITKITPKRAVLEVVEKRRSTEAAFDTTGEAGWHYLGEHVGVREYYSTARIDLEDLKSRMVHGNKIFYDLAAKKQYRSAFIKEKFIPREDD